MASWAYDDLESQAGSITITVLPTDDRFSLIHLVAVAMVNSSHVQQWDEIVDRMFFMGNELSREEILSLVSEYATVVTT